MSTKDLEKYYGVGSQDLTYIQSCVERIGAEIGFNLLLEDALALMTVLQFDSFRSADGFVINDDLPNRMISRFDAAAIVAELSTSGHDADWFKAQYTNAVKESEEFDLRTRHLRESLLASGRLRRN